MTPAYHHLTGVKNQQQESFLSLMATTQTNPIFYQEEVIVCRQ
jgi:hypothetical protein